MKTEDLHQRLRMRGFRCNIVYVRAASRLNVLPLYASRRQALRLESFHHETTKTPEKKK